MSLPEALRLEYLQAIGITSYFPRLQLPGAPVSVIVDQPVGEPESHRADAVEAVSVKPTVTASEPALAPPVPAPRTAHISKQATVGKTEPVIASVRAKQEKEEVRLQLLCIRACDNLAVLNAMPHIGSGQLSPRHSTLLANLLSACGITVGNMLVEDKPFRWPMVTGLHVDNSRRAAAAALSSYLQQKLADWQFGKLLVMGEEVVTRIFTNGGQEEGASHPKHSLEREDWQVIYTRSLDELLHRPELKKEAWAQIRKHFT